MTISALIIDDEQLARDELKYLLDQAGGVDVVAQGANGIEAVDLIEEHHPDVVFLDVQMPGLDGFAVIKRLMDRHGAKPGKDAEPLPQVVFATAYDQYAVRAFDVNAVDYLLKPFDRARVQQALERVRGRMAGNSTGALPEAQIGELLRILNREQGGARAPQFEMPDTRRVVGTARPGLVLARASRLCGKHQPHSRSGAVVQVDLPAAHERQETD
jgi:two-component system LytT family response regulator/two-component system response regulator LytT